MTREHRVSRRVRLGAACAALAPSAGEGRLAAAARAAPSSPFQRRLESYRRWDRALTLAHRAAARLEAKEEPTPAAAGDGAAGKARLDRRLGAFHGALRRLFRTPAPDFPALGLKLELAARHEVAALPGGRACLRALKQDARRLAARAS